MAALNLTLRQRKLLHTIQNQNDMITGQELARNLGASSRTIRSDVVTINHELEPYGARIDSVRSKGYFFTAKNPDRIRELNRIDTAFFTREDRIRYLALRLCVCDAPLNCFDLEDEMFISHTTLENDIRLLRLRYMMNGPCVGILTEHNGIRLEKDEMKIRRLMCDLCMEHWNYNGRGNAVYGMSFLDPEVLDRVIDLICVHLNRYGISMEDAAMVRLDLACTILHFRVTSGHPLPPAAAISRDNTKASLATEELMDALETALQFSVPPQERDQIFRLISSGHMMDSERLAFNTVADAFAPEVIGIADAWISAVRDTYGLDLAADEDFYITLLQEIRFLLDPIHPLVSHDRPELARANLLIETELAWLIQDIWAERTGACLCAQELLHIAHCTSGALEFFLRNHPECKSRTVIFCHQHMSIAWAIKRRILGAFDNYLNVTALLPVNAKSAFDFDQADLILSTVHKPITKHPGTDVVEISPYVTPSDIRSIETYIQENMILRFYPAMPSLQKLFDHAIWTEKDGYPDVFSAIDDLSSALVDMGVVDSGYTTAMLHREALCSHAIQSGALFQFALTPARQTQLSIAILKHRLSWGSCRIRVILTAAFTCQDRPLVFRIRRGICRMNRMEDVGSMLSREELESVIRSYM